MAKGTFRIEGVEDLTGGHPTLLQHRLGDGGEVEELRELVIVDADDGDVLGNPQPQLAGAAHDADGHLVGSREDRRRYS